MSGLKDSAQVLLRKGRYVAHLVQSDADLIRAQALRNLCFRGRPGLDSDRFDDLCQHVVVEADGELVCSYRVLMLESGAGLERSYSGQHYDLAGFSDLPGPVMELGRFCIHPQARDPDILRIAWAALTRQVDRAGVSMLCGCTSFRGTDPARHAQAFAVLRDRHLAPPGRIAALCAKDRFRFDQLTDVVPDVRRGVQGLPPLLRTYVMMGGWVSDHAVIDRDLDTLHVFTGLDIAAIPPARARLLRDLAG